MNCSLPKRNVSFPPVVVGRVSIVVPAYNSSATIVKTIESCLAQKYSDVEIIVVNDGSSDKTAEILDSFGERIKTIHQKNGGLAHARNVGVQAASGEFIAWMDADDIAEQDRLAKQQLVLAHYEDIALVSTSFSAFSDDPNDLIENYETVYYGAPNRIGGMNKIYPRKIPISGVAGDTSVDVGECRELLLWGNFVHPPTVMVRRNAFEKVGLFDTGLLYSSDYDWILRASRLGPFAFIQKSLLRYRLGAGQMSQRASAKIPLETIRVIEKIRQSDPALVSKNLPAIKAKIAECWLDAAEGALVTSRLLALNYLWQSAIRKPANIALARVLAKAVLPKFAVAIAKKFALAIGIFR